MTQTDRDLIVVKNEADGHRPFRSSFAVTSGVFYYEVIPVTDGEMRFGWATREARLGDWKNIGDDEHSIGLVLGNECYIYHRHDDYENRNKGKYRMTHVSPRSSPTVIGCLIDTPNRQFHFYLNGQKVQSPDNVHFSTQPYYATVSLGPKQQCQLNFGQAPFKFAPKDIRFGDFHGTSEDVGRYQMAKTVKYDYNFWFIHPLIANQVSQFYCDLEQVECDELVRQLEHIEHNQTTRLDHSVEGGRLVQSVIEVMQRRLTCDHNDRVGRLLRQVIGRIEYNNFEKVKFLELLYPYYQMSTTSTNSIKCHNISKILILLFYSFGHYFIHYLVKNFHNLDIFLSKHCSIETFQLFLNPKLFITDPLKLLNNLNCIESFPLPQTKRSLEHDSTLNWCGELFGEVSSVSRLYEPSCDLVRLQVGMCARWFRDHVMQTERHFPSQSTLDPEDRGEHIKLSSDCLSARNDYVSRQSVRSVCSVSSDIFYYEAVLITNGNMRIGWATKQSELDEDGIGYDEYSIGFDGRNEYEINHQFENFYDTSLISNSTSNPRWSVGDVVGCLIDCVKKIFRFYLNGKLVKCREKVKDIFNYEYSLHFSAQPYHAAVSLNSHQQVYLNLGQCPFRHTPSVPLRTFHQLSPSPPPPPLHSPRLSECYSLVQVLAKDRVELVFEDDEQKEFDELAKQIEQSKYNYDNVKLHTSLDRLRLLQSFISISLPTSPDSSLSVHANFVAHLLSQSTSANSAFPDLVAQLLYPYFTLHLTNHTAITHRNVCIVLSCLVAEMKDFHERINFYKIVFQYLTQIASNCNQLSEDWLFLYSIICLSNLDLEEIEKKDLKSNSNFTNIINAKKNLHEELIDISIFATNPNLSLMRQIVFLRQWTFVHLLNSNQSNFHCSLPNHETLDPSNCSAHLKLSPDLLSARSDRNWQSVRSLSSISSKRYYYEVTLVTSGPMRFGWAAENVDLTKNILGDDEYSIGFDGYNRCIWHRGKQFSKTLLEKPQWKEGDVVGCMILFEEKRFSFYLNGKLVPMSFLANFSTNQFYYPSASLFSFQQCQFSFVSTNFPHTNKQYLLNNQHIDLMFDDKEQTSLDESLKQIESSIYTKYPIFNAVQVNESLRMIQSFIEVTGEKFTYDRMNVVTEWTDQIIVQSATESSFVDNLIHLLYPYFTLHLTSNTARKHRNVCIVLSTLSNTMHHLPINLHELTLMYFTEIVCRSDEFSDEILLIIVLIGIGNMKLKEEERDKLKSNDKFCNALEHMSNPDLDDISILAKLSIVRQIVFLSQWTFDHLLNSTQSNLHSSLTNHETLDPSNCSAHLKLSPDLLSARSDRNWQSVRSVTSLSQRRYQDTVVYYEATLVTSGPMRIGWASENVQMSSGTVGDDQYSIGFDGHNRCIWHRGRQYPISNVPQWSAGDVIGCMVLIKQKRFAFYLNKEPIEFPFLSTLLLQSPHFSSVQSYYAAASLYTFQQCQFNFSVAQLPPRRPSFRVLDSVRNSINRGCRHLVLTGATVINSLINVQGRIEAGNITSTYIPGSDPSNCVINADRTIKLKSTNKSYNSHTDEEMFDEHEEDELLENSNKKNV